MYKLVNSNWETRNNTKWSIGQTNRATGAGKELCSPDLLHCYKSPVQAVLFNPIHANIHDPILLEIECSEILADDGLKYGCKEQMPLKELSLPKVTLEQKVAFTIYCALEVYSEETFVVWANNWLSGKDRRWRAAGEVTAATRSAYWASTAAAEAAEATEAAAAAAAAARAAYWSAAAAEVKLDFDSLIKKAGIDVRSH